MTPLEKVELERAELLEEQEEALDFLLEKKTSRSDVVLATATLEKVAFDVEVDLQSAIAAGKSDDAAHAFSNDYKCMHLSGVGGFDGETVGDYVKRASGNLKEATVALKVAKGPFRSKIGSSRTRRQWSRL